MPSKIQEPRPTLAERLGIRDAEHRPLDEIAQELDVTRAQIQALHDKEHALMLEHEQALYVENLGRQIF